MLSPYNSNYLTSKQNQPWLPPGIQDTERGKTVNEGKGKN